MHAIHIGTGSAQIADIAFEIVHFHHLAHFAHDALFAPRSNEFALVGADGAEGAAAKASAVHIHRMAYHLVGGDAFALVARVGQTGVRQIESGINLLGGHGRIGAIHLNCHIATGLP